MTFDLEDLEIQEISAVDSPANKHARVVLLKRDDAAEETPGSEKSSEDLPPAPKSSEEQMAKSKNGRATLIRDVAKYLGVGQEEGGALVIKEGDPMTTDENLDAGAPGVEDEVGKGNDALAAEVAKLREENATLKAGVEKAKNFDAFRKELPEALRKKFDGMDEEAKERFMDKYSKAEKSDDDPVMKAVTDLTKRNEELAEEIAKMRNADARRAVIEKLSDLKGSVDIEKLADRYIALPRDAADEMVEETRALAKQANEGALFAAKGKDGDAPASSDAAIDKAAAEIRKANPNLSEAQAITKALEINPDLYTDHLTEKGV